MKTVCLDFDGVVAKYDGWVNAEHVGDPFPGALEFIQSLVAKGIQVVISTARNDLEPVVRWLQKHNIPAHITHEKPIASIYIDDRGFRFEGDWDTALEAALRAVEQV